MTLYPHPLNRIAIAASTLFLGCLVWILAEPIWLLAPILIAGAILSTSSGQRRCLPKIFGDV